MQSNHCGVFSTVLFLDDHLTESSSFKHRKIWRSQAKYSFVNSHQFDKNTANLRGECIVSI